MAQTGYTPILIYSSSTAAAAPVAGNLTNSTLGSELAINITDGKLFYKDNANNVQVIGWKVVPATAGGTGQTSYAVGDLLYADTTTSLAKLADVATGNALISGGVGVAPAWGKIGLTTHVTGTLPVANGGTGTATAFTAGSVVFADASGVYSQNNSNLFWDNTNNRLGISQTPSTKLHIYDATDATIFVQSDGAVETALYRYSSDASSPINRFRKYRGTRGSPSAVATNDSVASILYQAFTGTNIRTVGSIDSIITNYTSDTNVSGAITFSTRNTTTNSAERARIHASGGVSIGNTTDPGASNLSVSGNVVIATSGKGIDFSATSGTGTSELLADYEEGTFTPTATNITGTNTYAGTYTKIGDRVYFEIIITTTTTIGITGASSTLTLPFASGKDNTCAAANRSTGAGYGNGLITASVAYPATATPSAAQSIVVSGSYRV